MAVKNGRNGDTLRVWMRPANQHVAENSFAVNGDQQKPEKSEGDGETIKFRFSTYFVILDGSIKYVQIG